jgi:hypothetical protein
VDLVVIGDVHFFGGEYWERRNIKIFFELFGEDVDGGSLPGVDFDHGDFVFKVAAGVDVLGAMWVLFALKGAVFGVAVGF